MSPCRCYRKRRLRFAPRRVSWRGSRTWVPQWRRDSSSTTGWCRGCGVWDTDRHGAGGETNLYPTLNKQLIIIVFIRFILTSYFVFGFTKNVKKLLFKMHVVLNTNLYVLTFSKPTLKGVWFSNMVIFSLFPKIEGLGPFSYQWKKAWKVMWTNLCNIVMMVNPSVVCVAGTRSTARWAWPSNGISWTSWAWGCSTTSTSRYRLATAVESPRTRSENSPWCSSEWALYYN